MHQAVFSVLVDGTDVSSRFMPFLRSLTVTLDDEGSMDEALIELSDAYAQLGLPRKRASVDIELGWSDTGVVQVFVGFCDEVRWHYARGGGRVMTIHCKSGDMGGPLKERMNDSMDNASLGDVAQKWGSKAGVDVTVSGALASIVRPYWYIGESFLAWIERRTHEVGGTFKVIGTRAALVPRNGNESASGATLEPITAECGVNVIEISAQPILSRPEYGQFMTRFYDAVAAEWKEAGGPGGVAGGPKHYHQFKAPTQDEAQRQSEANGDEVSRERAGAENVTITGEPLAQPKAACTVKGARPGVDGIYTVAKVTHTLSRGNGFRTQLALKDPSGDVGVDDRSVVDDSNDTPLTTPKPGQAGGVGGLPPDEQTGSGGIGSA